MEYNGIIRHIIHLPLSLVIFNNCLCCAVPILVGDNELMKIKVSGVDLDWDRNVGTILEVKARNRIRRTSGKVESSHVYYMLSLTQTPASLK